MRRVLGLGAAVIVAACSAAQTTPDESLDALEQARTSIDESMPEVDALSYAFELAIDDARPGRETYRARTTATFAATEALEKLTLDFEGNEVEEVRFGTTERTLSAATYRRNGKSLTIDLPSRTRTGQRFVVDVRYRGAFAQADGSDPNDFRAYGGLMVKQRNADGKRIFASLSWPYKARRFMPLRDHPRDGATIEMSLTFPESFEVIANGDRKSVTGPANGSRTWHFQSSAAMPTYDFHLAAYEGWTSTKERARSGVEVASHLYSRHAEAGRVVTGDLPEALDFFEQTFGRYRFGERVSFLEVPIFGGGMENATVVSLDETLFSDPRGGREVAFHELAHHWSGNLVRIRTWNDFWLSEGFTDYLMGRAIAARDDDMTSRKLWASLLGEALESENQHPLRPGGRKEGAELDEIDVLTIFDSTSYKKGARVLRMLEGVVGEAELTKFLKGWFERHAFRAVTTPQLERELSQETGKDLKPFFDQFVYGQGAPTVNVSFASVTDGADGLDVTVEQTGLERADFPLELSFKTPRGERRVVVDVRGARTTKRVSVPAGASAVTVDPDDRLYGTTRCDATQKCKAAYTCRAGTCVVN